MPPISTSRLALAALALFAEALHLAWEALHGGIFSHHLLQRVLPLLLALLLPAHRPESLFGFALGMSWTFGAVLPMLAGGIIMGLSWAVRGTARWGWRAVRPA